MDLAGIGAILGGVGGLFGGKTPKPSANIVSQAKGARDAARRFGFSPLTMLQYGQPGGVAGGGGGAPLASIQMIVDGLAGVDDEMSGDAARRRAADQLNLDLAQLKLDQARSGVVAVTPQYAADGIPGGMTFGRRPTTVTQSNGGPRGATGGAAGSETDRLNDPVDLPDGDTGGVGVPAPRLDRGAGGYALGLRWDSAPGWSPAQVIEDEYGDVASWGYGLAKSVADVGHNGRRLADWAGITEPDDALLFEDEADKRQRKESAKRTYSGEGGDASVGSDWWKHQFPL